MRRVTVRAALLCAALASATDCRRSPAGIRDPYAAEIAPLVEAIGARRPIEGRLTGGFRYGEWRQPRGVTRDLQLDATIARLERSAVTDRAKAVAELLGGDANGAIAAFERMLSR